LREAFFEIWAEIGISGSQKIGLVRNFSQEARETIQQDILTG
jgi:hypothetical protein